MDALRQVFAEFGITWEGSALEAGAVQVDGMVGRLREFAGALAGSAVLGAIRGFANGIAEESSALQDNADQLGVTAGELQELQHAGVMAGLSAERTSAALLRLQQSAADAARGAKGPAAAFRALGVQVRDASGHVRPLGEIMDDLGPAFGRVEDAARSQQLAQDIWGRSGARMATVMHEGAGGLAALRAEVEALGGGLLPDAIEAANAYDDAMDRQKVATRALRSVLAVEVLPTLTDLVTRTTKAAAWFSRITRDTHFLQVALGLLGAAGALSGANFLRAWAPAIARFGGFALVLLAVAAVVDDLVTLAEGGDSAIGEFVDATFGLGTAARLAQTLNEGWAGMVQYLGELGAAAVQLFGTDLPGWLADLGDEVAAPFVAAWEFVAALWAQIGPTITAPFTAAWGVVESVFNAAWARIGGAVTGLFSRVTGTLGRVAGALGLDEVAQRVSDAVAYDSTAGRVARTAGESAADIAQVFRDVRDEYADIFSGRNGALAAAAPAVAPPARGAAVNQRTVRVERGAVQVSGVSDPRAAAEHAVRRIEERERNAIDAALPTNGSEG